VEAQIRACYEILEAKKARKDDELWKIAEVFMKRFGMKRFIVAASIASERSCGT